jgi:hypothetical protein
MSDPKIKRSQIDPGQLEATLREAAQEASLTRIEIGEGPDRVIVAEANPTRQCGACTLCCTVAGVNELQKLPMKRCAHLVRGGGRCGIYADRPKSCAAFSCGWLLGNFDERFRPDKIGAYVAFFMTEEFGFYAVVQCMTARLKPKRLEQMVRQLAAWLPEVRVVYDDKRGFILRRGQPIQRFRARPDMRDPADYESLIYELIEEPAR